MQTLHMRLNNYAIPLDSKVGRNFNRGDQHHQNIEIVYKNNLYLLHCIAQKRISCLSVAYFSVQESNFPSLRKLGPRHQPKEKHQRFAPWYYEKHAPRNPFLQISPRKKSLIGNQRRKTDALSKIFLRYLVASALSV